MRINTLFRIDRTSAGIVALAVAYVFLAFVGWTLYEKALRNERASVLRADVDNLKISLLATIANERGFLLTAQPRYYGSYVVHRAILQLRVSALCRYLGETPAEEKLCRDVRDAVFAKEVTIDKVVLLAKLAKPEEALDLIRSDNNWEDMRDVESALDRVYVLADTLER